MPGHTPQFRVTPAEWKPLLTWQRFKVPKRFVIIGFLSTTWAAKWSPGLSPKNCCKSRETLGSFHAAAKWFLFVQRVHVVRKLVWTLQEAFTATDFLPQRISSPASHRFFQRLSLHCPLKGKVLFSSSFHCCFFLTQVRDKRLTIIHAGGKKTSRDLIVLTFFRSLHKYFRCS